MSASGEIDFTVVTPNFNYGRFLGECLASVAGQEGVRVEHLVIDGGSTDDSEEVVRGYEGVDWQSESDEGMSDAINKGFVRARGRWVMWLNADDRLKPGALREVKEFAEGKGELDVIYGGWDFVDDGMRLKKRMSVFPMKGLMLRHMGCYIGSTACFVNRERVLEAGHLLDASFHYVMDGEFYCRLLGAGMRFGYLPVCLADFRLHGENQSFRNRGEEGVRGRLRLEQQYAESRTIRRVYGVTLFESEHANSVVDACLYFGCRVQKAFLGLVHRRRLRMPR
ncbi:MAG: glycosyltransferase family 2 protein [Verrucomicrobiaceae bacterium]